MEEIKRKVYYALHPSYNMRKVDKVIDGGIITLIILNTFAVVLGTVESIASKYGDILYFFEVVSIVIFSFEYIFRLWSSTVSKKYSGRFLGRVKYVLRPLSIIDLVAILPFYLGFMQFDLIFLRAVRIFRIFALLKMTRYATSMHTLIKVLHSKKEELSVTVIAVMVLMVIASSIMYYTENSAQPEVFSSIPASMWWAVITFTTVGYGDVVPVTVLGKLFGGIISVLGIGLFVLPSGILASAFAEEIRRKKKVNVCPHCGNVLDGEDIDLSYHGIDL